MYMIFTSLIYANPACASTVRYLMNLLGCTLQNRFVVLPQTKTLKNVNIDQKNRSCKFLTSNASLYQKYLVENV